MPVNDETTERLQARTNAKLRYALIHLEELRDQGPPDGGDFDKAHQESFLFHLFGAIDALLAELNHYYAAGLQSDSLSPGKIREALKRRDASSPELQVLYQLEKDESSWFSKAKNMRDHSTHVQGVNRAYFLGGEDHKKVKLRDPESGELTEHHFIIEFEEWNTAMFALVKNLRSSAVRKGLQVEEEMRKPS
jgi:hypothetical protein